MDPTIKTAADAWLNDPVIADGDKQEIRGLLNRGDEAELTDRFYQELEFGTGGLRGIVGAGLNRMNVYTVGAAAQGLANYIASQGDPAKKAGLVVAYDCRRQSREFALRTASVTPGTANSTGLSPPQSSLPPAAHFAQRSAKWGLLAKRVCPLLRCLASCDAVPLRPARLPAGIAGALH